MTHFRLMLVVAFAIVLSGSGWLPTMAQDAAQQPAPLGEVATPDGEGTLPGDPQIQLVKVADGLGDPINVAHAPDGSGRLFVVERIGRVRIIDQNGELLPDPFLDIQTLVKTDHLEQGLLGVAFHPDYTNNGLFYVYYSDFRTNGDHFLVEYAVSQDDPNVADPESARVMLTQDDPYTNHNGGTILFGPDNYLYVAIGDGGLAGDPYNNAQRLDTILGKMLRIDVNTRDAGAYGIPSDNPFANTGEVISSNQANQMAQNGDYNPNARQEICNWGLRNPWQHSFDSQTGEYYITDVGQNGFEEVNFFPEGQTCGWNLGWDLNEGAHCYPPGSACDKMGALPVANYSHDQGDCSITGIGVYRGQVSTSLDGIYFNTDFCSGTIYGLTRDDSGAWVYDRLLSTALGVTGSGRDEAGELYLTACTCEYTRGYDPLENPGGTVWRLVAADQVPEGAETAPAPESEAPADASPAAEATQSPAAAETTTPADNGSPAAGESQGQRDVTVEMVDIAFNPSEFTIPANTDVTITLPNNGVALHSFVISDHKNEGVPNLNIKVEVQPGQTGTVTVNAPPGDYYFFCDVPGHEAAGMYGTMRVQ